MSAAVEPLHGFTSLLQGLIGDVAEKFLEFATDSTSVEPQDSDETQPPDLRRGLTQWKADESCRPPCIGGIRGRMHISFLLHNAYGIGGTIRTTYNTAR